VPLDDAIAEEARSQYSREYDRYAKLARHVAAVCSELIEPAGIQATIQYRAKDPVSFHRKLLRYLAENNAEKISQIDVPRDALDMMGDLAAVRVATYVEAERGRVVELIRSRFRGTLPDGTIHVDSQHKESGYRATHCQVLLPDDLLSAQDVKNMRDTSAEIQVCSMLAHVWNEIEHNVGYKFSIPWGVDEIALRDQRLQEFHDATDVGDACIEALLGLRSERVAASLCAGVGAQLEGVVDFASNGTAVLKEVVRLGYTTHEQVRSAFLNGGSVERGRALIGTINVAFEVGGVSAELSLNPNNADVLLALLIERHCGDLTALYERQLTRGDALRAARIAQAVKDTQALPQEPA
jgi:ppGpp synthetase/RelA/SpoT-type nucleotidyltranferase